MEAKRWLTVFGLIGLLLTGGCSQTESVRSEILRNRVERFRQWRTEAAGREATRPVLTGSLSVEAAVTTALANSREVEIALWEQDKARARLLEAYSAALPKADVDFSYTRLAQDVLIGDEDNYALSGTISQPLYRGGETAAGVRAARLFSLLTEETLRGAQQEVIFAARQAYYDARLAMELEKASADAVVVARRLLEDTRKQYEAGTVSSVDVLRADVELKSLVAENVQDQNRVHLAMTSLFNVLGVSQESRVELSDALRYAPVSPPVEEAVRTAFLQQSDILQGEWTVRLYREGVSADRSGYYPEVDAFFTETYARPDPKNPAHIEWNDTWSTGVTLKYRLFEGFKTVALVRQAEIDYAQSQVRLRDTEERVLLAIKQALFSLEDAAKAVISQQANVEQATEAQRLVELGFREGVRKQVEVLDARRALTRAQAQYAQALYDHEVARLQYERSTGILDPAAPGFVRYPPAESSAMPVEEGAAEGRR